MPVFISHRTADDAIAKKVHDRLTTHHGIKCYLDDLDRQTTTANITALIVRRVKECTNLLALVTPNTRGSWWVPFEVGVAREAPRIITSFTNLVQSELPEYLKEWPVLRGDSAVDTFARYYKSAANKATKHFAEGREYFTANISDVDSFHRQLKTALGQ
jgi:hypothetical protein